MRIDFKSPIQFGDELTAQKYAKRCEAARASQQSRWVVAPEVSVFTPNGMRLAGGTAVTLELMAGAQPSPAQHIQRLVAQGYLLEANAFDDGPQAA